MLTIEQKIAKLEEQKRRRFRKKYGVFPLEYDKLFKKQGSCCKLCKGLNKDHLKSIEGKLFCDSCYTVIKILKTNPKLINRLNSFINTEGE